MISEMTPRQRILVALRHQMGDRLTWAPYFRTWWEAHQHAGEMPDFLQPARTYLEAFSPMKLSILDKGASSVRAVFDNTEIKVEAQSDGLIRTRFLTPIGEVYSIHQPTSAYDHTNYKVRYEFHEWADYPVIRYMYEHLRYEASYEEYLTRQSNIGEAGQYMSEGPDTPLHQIFVHLIGYESSSYFLHDHPREMDTLLGIMMEKNEEALQIISASPAPVILTPDNTNSDFETPKLFKKYSLPYLKRASEVCHASGKVHVGHMCGKLKALLPLIAEANLDGIESLTPPPYADTYLWEARQALPDVCIIGGVSPHLLVGNYSRSDIEAYLLNLFEKMAPGDNFILAISDDTPADAEINRFLWITELVERCGSLPFKQYP